MEPVKTIDVTLNVNDVDCFNHWKPSSIAELMLQVANTQCNETGWGWDELLAKGVCLVMTRTHIEMTEYPGANHTVRISTWADPNMRLVINRFFLFEYDGRKIGQAAVETVMIDFNSRKIVRGSRYNLEICPYTANMPECTCSVNKTGAEAYDFAAPITTEERPVRFNNLDYNRHLHNTQYIAFAEDMLGLEFFENRVIKSVDIKYDKELHYGDTPVLEMAPLANPGDDKMADLMIMGNCFGQTNFEIIVKSTKK